MIDVADDTLAVGHSGGGAALAERLPEVFAGRVNLGQTGRPGSVSDRDLLVDDSPEAANFDEGSSLDGVEDPFLTDRIHKKTPSSARLGSRETPASSKTAARSPSVCLRVHLGERSTVDDRQMELQKAR